MDNTLPSKRIIRMRLQDLTE